MKGFTIISAKYGIKQQTVTMPKWKKDYTLRDDLERQNEEIKWFLKRIVYPRGFIKYHSLIVIQ